MQRKELTKSDEVLALMRAGHEVRNHGASWWIGLPRQPYQAHETRKVADGVISGLEEEGLITTRLTGNSAIAEIVNNAK